MAKSGDAGFIGRHIEKFVLGICAALFVFVTVRWVGGSSRGLDGVAPGQIDKKLRDKADRLLEQNKAVEPQPYETPALASRLQQTKDTGIAEPAGTCVVACPSPPLNMPRALVDLPPLSVADLTPVPAPEKPKFWAGWELPRTSPRSLSIDTGCASR